MPTRLDFLANRWSRSACCVAKALKSRPGSRAMSNRKARSLHTRVHNFFVKTRPGQLRKQRNLRFRLLRRLVHRGKIAPVSSMLCTSRTRSSLSTTSFTKRSLRAFWTARLPAPCGARGILEPAIHRTCASKESTDRHKFQRV